MQKRPTRRDLDVKLVAKGQRLYKGITNLSRVYEKPVFFTFDKNYAEKYAKARLGDYTVAKDPLRLIHLTPRTIRSLMKDHTLNKQLLQFAFGVNIPARNQIALVESMSNSKNEANYRRRVMMNNLASTGSVLDVPGGRKSFYDTDLKLFKSLCVYCKIHGYDGFYSSELRSPFHSLFGAELVICEPTQSLENINFLLAK